MDIAGFSALIETLYAAAAEPDLWAGLAPKMAAAFGAHSCSIQLQYPSRNRVELLTATPNLEPKFLRDYADHYHSQDLWVAAAKTIGLGGIYTGQDLIDDEVLRKTAFYRDWLREGDIFHLLASATPLDRAGGFGLIGIHRHERAEAFGREDKYWARLLLPHILRSLEMRALLATAEREKQLGFAALSALAMGAILAGPQSEILFANPMAEGLLRRGTAILSSRGRLRARDHAQAVALEAAIRAAAQIGFGTTGSESIPPPAATIALGGQDGTRLSALICPLPPSAWHDGLPCVLVFLSDNGQPQTSIAGTLAALYGLTPAQARLFAALLDGIRIEDYAQRAEITANTANTLLKQIFAKTGQHRQSDLIRQALSDRIVLMTRFRRGDG